MQVTGKCESVSVREATAANCYVGRPMWAWTSDNAFTDVVRSASKAVTIPALRHAEDIVQEASTNCSRGHLTWLKLFWTAT